MSTYSEGKMFAITTCHGAAILSNLMWGFYAGPPPKTTVQDTLTWLAPVLLPGLFSIWWILEAMDPASTVSLERQAARAEGKCVALPQIITMQALRIYSLVNRAIWYTLEPYDDLACFWSCRRNASLTVWMAAVSVISVLTVLVGRVIWDWLYAAISNMLIAWSKLHNTPSSDQAQPFATPDLPDLPDLPGRRTAILGALFFWYTYWVYFEGDEPKQTITATIIWFLPPIFAIPSSIVSYIHLARVKSAEYPSLKARWAFTLGIITMLTWRVCIGILREIWTGIQPYDPQAISTSDDSTASASLGVWVLCITLTAVAIPVFAGILLLFWALPLLTLRDESRDETLVPIGTRYQPSAQAKKEYPPGEALY